ncbi:UNVERIFIED_CONTAM: hypothetical protein Sradi_0893600 [Sesamum radiatum]|uniref:Uncharacterized protein n=1 Tax=Sesamum radiatum TaxID=300843 RepID=A0AAW2V3U4_SESRA
MFAPAGGSSPPSHSYRDAIAGVAACPLPSPMSLDTASFRSMGMLTQDQGMKDECYEKHKTKAAVRLVDKDDQRMIVLDYEDLRVKLDAQRAQRDLNDCRRGKHVASDDSASRSHLEAGTSGAKGHGKETRRDVLHRDAPETMTKEVVLGDVVDGRTEGPSHVSHTTPTDDHQVVVNMSTSGMESVVLEHPTTEPEVQEFCG